MNSWLSFRDAYLPGLNEFLAKFIAEERQQEWGVAHGTLCLDMADYQLSTGGKRLRGLIPSFVFQEFSQPGFGPERAFAIGAAVEILHNATLVHDDLQDGDTLRRGQPTVWKKYSEAQAINGGDAMFQLSLLALQRFECRGQVSSMLTRTFSRHALSVIEGQAQEIALKEEEFPGVDRYLSVIRGKTSGLFGLPISASLEALEVDLPMREAASRIFSDLGVLFQIQDDFLDLYGDKGRESIGNDVREGKVSFFVAHANETGTPTAKAALVEILRKPRDLTTAEDVSAALQIFEDTNGKKAAGDRIWAILRKVTADQSLRELPEIRRLALLLGEVFLEPIRSFLSS